MGDAGKWGPGGEKMISAKQHRDTQLNLLLRAAGGLTQPDRCAAFYREGFSCAQDFYKGLLGRVLKHAPGSYHESSEEWADLMTEVFEVLNGN